ncbi:MAG: aspartate kinase [Rhizobiales bacterium]|nr:aspartate kinase [Hyphomicrobiales bacterium]NRB15142.1 aspartate kinase [Hyphomicrobiales bacterium]
MARIVMKFGGTSVADIDCIKNVAKHVKREIDAGNQVAVVLSAMSGTTNQLVNWTSEASPMHDAREYDAIVASGEQITIGLLAVILQSMGVNARSWLGWQIPIKTSSVHGAARIEDINGDEIIKRMEAESQVAVIAGFQGIAQDGRITTLGRGGSDTTAVAIAAAINADICDIYTDVDGVYTTDPRIVPNAKKLARVSYEEMLEMASLGAKVLLTRSVELAMIHKVRLAVRSSFEDPETARPTRDSDFTNLATGISNHPGTLVCDEDEIMEQELVSGITYSKDEAKLTLVNISDRPGISARIFTPLAEANVNVDMIVQNVSEDGKFTNMTFTVPSDSLKKAQAVIEENSEYIGYEKILSSTNIVKISVIGVGMRSHAGVAAKMFETLAQKGINIIAITTSEIKVSVLIDAEYIELAVRALHTAYDLDVN